LHGWTLDLPILIGTVVGVVLYMRGLGWQHAAPTSDSRSSALATRATTSSPSRSEEGWRLAAFLVALAALIAASCSPIDSYAGSLFWVHMIQHLLILVVVSPLFVVAAPWYPLWYGLPPFIRHVIQAGEDSALYRVLARAVWIVWRPSVCFALFVVGTWVWHYPALYDLALRNDVVHDYGEHNTFLLIGMAFWLQILPSPPVRAVLGSLGRAVLLLLAIVQNVILSVVLGFAPHPLYAPYAELLHRPGGLSAHADQQLGAAIMWSVGDLPFVIAIMWLVQRWLSAQMAEPADEIEMAGIVGVGS
jgi:cytochrome c oxidase assembly factor CtaG